MDRGRQALERAVEADRARGAGAALLQVGQSPSGAQTPGPRVWESTSRIWLDPSRDRVRVERVDEHGEFFMVRVGERWWSYHPNFGATSNEDDPKVGIGGADEVGGLLDPALLLGSLDFVIVGEGEQAGLHGIVVRARPRPIEGPDLLRQHLPGGADDYELVVDHVRGVLLRLEARIDGAAFSIVELVETHFDETFADDVFVFRPPPGERIRPHGEMFPPVEAMTLEEAARRAPFTVLAPHRIPQGWQLNVLISPERDRPPAPAGVVMHIVDPAHRHQLRIMQGAEPIQDALEWVPVDFAGQRFLVHEAKGPFHGHIEVRLERHGTHARLTGDIERSQLLEIAQSLQPAPRELPPLMDQ
jgi:outer membrane lipoprotein-sorting protein